MSQESHAVWYNGKYIRVCQHPLAIPTYDSANLACISASQNISFKIGEHRFLDFAEKGTVTGVPESFVILF
jgi:hypothetical protein